MIDMYNIWYVAAHCAGAREAGEKESMQDWEGGGGGTVALPKGGERERKRVG